MSGIVGSNLGRGSGLVKAGGIADNAVTLAKMAGGTDGNLISYDTSGDPVAVASGTDGQVLTSAGAGAVCLFEDAAGGTTLSGSTNNTVATVTGANALIGEANLTFDGTDLAIASGNLNVASGYGIDFSATADGSDGDATMTSELLDDYEEGTWTATVSADSGTITLASGGDECTYVKIGNHVWLGGSLDPDSVSSPSGNLTINNKPFNTSGGEGGHRGVGHCMIAGAASTNGGHTAMIFESYAPIRIEQTTDSAQSEADLVDAGSEIRFHVDYQVP